MILKNARIFDSDFQIVKSDLSIQGESIERVAPDLTGDDTYDLTGCLIAPGFVDIHIHGCAGADTCDGTRDALERMAGHLARLGVTSFCPTTMTLPMDRLESILGTIRGFMQEQKEGAAVLGVNLEGPYISPAKRGAQKETFVRNPDWREFKRLYEACGGIVRLVDIAPERQGGMEFAEQVSKLCRVSLAHTEAGYDQAMESFRHGITHVTHLFNAMPGLHHREPGAVGAAFDDASVKAELICDGFHIHPAVLRAAFRALGESRSIIVSDSMRAAGLPDGVSELGGQTVYVKDGRARLENGTIAGATTNLYDEVKNLINFGIPLRQVIRSATINPAAAIGADDVVGSILPGKRADLIVFDGNFERKFVVLHGEILR